MNPTSQKLEGIFCPHPVPLDQNGHIDEPQLRFYIDWLIEHGVHGLYTNGSAGEFLRFNLEERRRICRIVCSQVAGRVPVIAGATENNIRETIESCELFKSYGARSVALLPPIYYKLSSEGIYAHFKEIATHSPIGLTLYNIPLFCSPIETSVLKRLAMEHENVIAMKDSSGDVAYVSRAIAAIKPGRPDFSVLSGWEATMLPALLMGADGGTLGSSAALPEVTRKLYELFKAKRFDEAVHLQLRLIEFFDEALYGADFPEGMRAAVELRGIRMGASRQPSVTPRAKLDHALSCIMSDFGLVDSPNGTCPTKTSALAGQKVSLDAPGASLAAAQENCGGSAKSAPPPRERKHSPRVQAQLDNLRKQLG